MEVIDSTSANLSNYEVLQLLQNLRDNDSRKQLGSLATIKYKTVKYLESSPCANQSDDIVATFLKAVQKFNLTKSEKLVLLNLRPTTEVEIQLIITESEDRLTEEEIQELLTIIEETLPISQPESELM